MRARDQHRQSVDSSEDPDEAERAAEAPPAACPSSVRSPLRAVGPAERQDLIDIDVRPRNDVDGDHLADALRGALPGLGRRLHRRDVAAHDAAVTNPPLIFS